MMPTPHPAVKPDPIAGTVDTHFHAFPPTSAGVPGARYVPDYAAPIEAWQAAVTPHGVTHGVLVQPSFLGTDNVHLLHLLSARPSQLRGVVVVAPDIPAAALQAMDTLGVRGIRLNLVGGDHQLGAAWFPLFERLEALDWHVQVHTDHGRLEEVLHQIPRSLTVVVDHFGKPVTPQEPDRLVATQQDRLYVKLSAAYRLAPGCDAEDLAARWLDRIGPMRLVWGSDWPCTAHESAQAASVSARWLSRWLASATMTEVVLTANALSLYRF